MAIQIPDAKIAANLSAAQFPTDVYGPDGEMLGRFIPTSVPGMTYPESGLSDEELDKLANDPNAKWVSPGTSDGTLAGDRQVFKLIWRDSALDALAEHYVAADPNTRQKMASLVEAMNKRLRNDPLSEGESRPGHYRVTFLNGLTITFEVSVGKQLVRVIRVHPYGKRR